MATTEPAFTDLYFGLADGKNEAIEHPDEFIQSFVDHNNVVEEVSDKRKLLLLGPKGTGKSAVAWYVELTARSRNQLVQTRDISELPLTEIGKVKTGEDEGPGRSLTAWRILLLCSMIDVILSDQASSLNQNSDFLRVVEALRREGFLDPTFKRAVLSASKSTFKLSVTGIGEYSREASPNLNLYHLVPYLVQWIKENQSPNRHLLFLDGLDSIYLTDSRYTSALSSLLQAAYLLRQELVGSTSHLVLLVRNDIFTRLQLADSGKMRDDFGVDLDWRMLTGRPERSALFRLINSKAPSLLGTGSIDVVGRYFSPNVELGARRGGPGRAEHIWQYLLNLTRHTPRDLLQLLENIRRVCKEDPGALDRQGRVRPDALREGVLRYATRHFVGAIQNELVGRDSTDPEMVSRAISTLRNLPGQSFTAEQFTRDCFDDNSDANRAQAAKLLSWLFFAGAIGNERPGRNESYLQFYHRRDETEVYLKGRLRIHNALVYAQSTPFG
jgi:hypothetical protein